MRTRLTLSVLAVFVLLALIIAPLQLVWAGAPPTEWDKTFGGTDGEFAESVQQTADGGYVLAGGYTGSYGAHCDFWLIKTDSAGNETWDKTFGGTGDDEAYCVQQTSDGGYVLAGWTTSYGAGSYDAWLIKTDSAGNETWDKTFGGAGGDLAESVQQTADGGYVLAGYTRSSSSGPFDAWLIKTDSAGNETWDKTFGGTYGDYAYCVQQTADGGYVLAGYTGSYGAGDLDAWLIKTDSAGNKTWDKTFGDTGEDVADSFQQTADGGYVLAGYTCSYGAEDYDAWLIKTDSAGNKTWDKTFGGTGFDLADSVQQTADGGYVLAGYTDSYGAGGYDAWLIKVASEGTAPPPTVTGITPNLGTRGQTVSVTDLAGTGFQDGATARLEKGWATIDATDVVFVSSSKLTCSIPLAGDTALGTWDVVVTNPDAQEGRLAGGFTVNAAPPTVTGITPNSGTRGQTVSVTNLAGTGFQDGATVRLENGGATINATGVGFVSSSKLTCSIPLAGDTALGTWDVVVSNPDAQEGRLAGGFTVNEQEVGQVVMCFGDASVSGSPAINGHPIRPGDVMLTGDDGYLEIAIEEVIDGVKVTTATIALGPNTQLTITPGSTPMDILLDLLEGQIYNKVMKLPDEAFEVITPVCAIGVRGTEFIVEADETHSTVTDLQGSVEVSTPDGAQSAVLGENSALQATLEGIGDPYTINPDDVDKWWDVSTKHWELETSVRPAGDTYYAAWSANADGPWYEVVLNEDAEHPGLWTGESAFYSGQDMYYKFYDGEWSTVVFGPEVLEGDATVNRYVRSSYPSPTITSITPAYGVENAVVGITNLAGTGFQEGATVRIEKTGTTVNATDVTVVSATKITCKLNLSGAPLGKYDVVVRNPDAQETKLTQGFSVTNICGGGAAISLSIFGIMMGLMSLAGSAGLRRRLRRKKK